MQKILFILIFSVFALLSCSKEGLEKYSSTNSILFENRDMYGYYVDSSTLTFAYSADNVTDTIFKLVVKVTGAASNEERTFKIGADPTSTARAGIHYELPATFTFPAGKIVDTFGIRLIRTADMKDNPVDLILVLEPTEDFTTNMVIQGNNDAGFPMSYLRYKINFSDILVEPQGWYSYLGKFTKKKMDLICDIAGTTPSFLNNGDEELSIGSPYYELKIIYFGELLNAFLTANINAGTPVYYEDGVTPMSTEDYYD